NPCRGPRQFQLRGQRLGEKRTRRHDRPGRAEVLPRDLPEITILGPNTHPRTREMELKNAERRKHTRFYEPGSGFSLRKHGAGTLASSEAAGFTPAARANTAAIA